VPSIEKGGSSTPKEPGNGNEPVSPAGSTNLDSPRSGAKQAAPQVSKWSNTRQNKGASSQRRSLAKAFVAAGATAVVFVVLATFASSPAVSTGPLDLGGAVLMPYVKSNPEAFYQEPSPIPPGPLGSVIRVQPMPPYVELPKGANAYRILYRSIGMHGLTAVSGFIVVPKGPVPKGGFPIVDYAHATTGIANLCAPSMYAFLDVPYVSSLVRDKYVIVATDYPGLGTAPPFHVTPYLVAGAEARSVLDAARAALDLPFAHAANEVMLMGYSQGAQAVLKAEEIASSYAPELHLVETVAFSAPNDLSVIVNAARKTSALAAFYVLLAASWRIDYPDLKTSDLLSPTGQKYLIDAYSICVNKLTEILHKEKVGTSVLSPRAQSYRLFQELLKQNSVPSGPITVPTLLASGAKDQLIPLSITKAWVKKACRIDPKAPLEWLVQPGAGHGGVIPKAKAKVLSWMKARLAGKPALVPCGRF
jgi:pimeloyl-ACP methyl ester carboxylesterase